MPVGGGLQRVPSGENSHGHASLLTAWLKHPIFLFEYETMNADKIKPAEAGWFCVISCAVHAPLGALAALYATDDDIHGEVHERQARLGGRELMLRANLRVSAWLGGSAHDPATITSSFLTDLTPSTFEATCAALSRSARLFAVPYSVTTPPEAPASIASIFNDGSAPRADLTLIASAASSSILGAFGISTAFCTTSIFASGWGVWTSGPVAGLVLSSLFHSDWIWSHAARLTTSAPAVTAERAPCPFIFHFMIRSSLREYPLQTRYDSNKFPESIDFSQAPICTVAAARQPPSALHYQGQKKKRARAPSMPGPLNLDARLAAVHA